MKMLSRYAPMCSYRTLNSLQLFGLVQCLQQAAFVRSCSIKSSRDDHLLSSVVSSEKELETLEKLFRERVNCADLSTNEDNLTWCLNMVDVWLQNSHIEKADWAIQIIEDSAFKFGLPYNAQVLQYLATLRFKQRRFQDSVDTLHRIKAIGLEHPGTLINLGIVYSAMENYDNAAFYYEKAAVIRSSISNPGTHSSHKDLVERLSLEDLRPMYSPDRYHFQNPQSKTKGNKEVIDSNSDTVLKQVRDRDNAERRYREAYDALEKAVDC